MKPGGSSEGREIGRIGSVTGEGGKVKYLIRGDNRTTATASLW